MSPVDSFVHRNGLIDGSSLNPGDAVSFQLGWAHRQRDNQAVPVRILSAQPPTANRVDTGDWRKRRDSALAVQGVWEYGEQGDSGGWSPRPNNARGVASDSQWDVAPSPWFVAGAPSQSLYIVPQWMLQLKRLLWH